MSVETEKVAAWFRCACGYWRAPADGECLVCGDVDESTPIGNQVERELLEARRRRDRGEHLEWAYRVMPPPRPRTPMWPVLVLVAFALLFLALAVVTS